MREWTDLLVDSYMSLSAQLYTWKIYKELDTSVY